MKRFIIISFFILGGSTLISSCSDSNNSEKQIETSIEVKKSKKWQCPMNCEHDKVYDEPLDCPLCGMDMAELD